MNIDHLQEVISALESEDRLSNDDFAFLQHLLENKENDLTQDEIRWLSEITQELKE